MLESQTKPKEDGKEIIRTKYWELPADSLDGWRPYTAYLDWRIFEGPEMGPRDKGLSFRKNMMGGCNGPRGACKSASITFFLCKLMRMGLPVWTNYPISFFTVEPDGKLTYYESMPLDVQKLTRFDSAIRYGAVGVTELQYYVEARTSGRLQNRMMGYSIMQIRKTANSFLYDVQNQPWVDKRFGWSDDFNIECTDVSRTNYQEESIRGLPRGMLDEHGYLKEGAVALWNVKDNSGILTGVPYSKSGIIYDGIQFDAWYFWDAYPTHFLIDAWEAYHSIATQQDQKNIEYDKMINALNATISDILESGETKIFANQLWNKASEKYGEKINSYKAGRILKEAGVEKKLKSTQGEYEYDLSVFLEESQ